MDIWVLLVSIIIIIITVTLFSLWENVLRNKENYKNTTLVDYSKSNQTNLGNPIQLHDVKNPLLDPPVKIYTSKETSTSQPFSGYQKSSLHQPCNDETDDSGLPNLPSSYVLQNCSDGQVCTDSLTKGKICLSKPGYFCNNKQDCSPDSDECIGNICLSRTNKLNSLCETNEDCFTPLNNNNLSCVQTDFNKKM